MSENKNFITEIYDLNLNNNMVIHNSLVNIVINSDKLPKFYGKSTESFEDWLQIVNDYIEQNQITNDKIIMLIKPLLKSKPLDIVRQFQKENPCHKNNWEEVSKVLDDNFNSIKTKQNGYVQCQRKLFDIRKKFNLLILLLMFIFYLFFFVL